MTIKRLVPGMIKLRWWPKKTIKNQFEIMRFQIDNFLIKFYEFSWVNDASKRAR
jgi:hypothetical protein